MSKRAPRGLTAAASPLFLSVLVAAALAFPASGAAAPPEGEPPAPEPAPELAFSSQGYDFGVQRINSGGVGLGFQLTNSGEAPVQVNNVDVVEPDPNIFWVNTDCGGRWLNPGQSCFGQVYFGPREQGPYSAQLRASVNGASFTAGLTGIGGQAVVSAVPNPVDFGLSTVGASGATRTVTLTNSGNLAAGYFVGVIAGGDVGSFRLLDTSCVGVPLAPGGSCTAHVRFSPTGPGPKIAALSFFGEAEGGTQVTLSGEGVSPALTLAPSGYDFGSHAVGEAGAARWFSVRNEGATPVDLSAASILGPDLDQFTLAGDTCAATTLGAGQECLLKVRFRPDSSGEKAATLRVAGGGVSLATWLSGRATPARVTDPRSAPRRHRLRHRLRHGKAVGAIHHRVALTGVRQLDG